MISSHSWNVDLRGQDEYEGVNLQMRPFDPNTLSRKDAYRPEYKASLNWEQDYQNK